MAITASTTNSTSVSAINNAPKSSPSPPDNNALAKSVATAVMRALGSK